VSSESDDQKADTHPQGHEADEYLQCIILASYTDIAKVEAVP